MPPIADVTVLLMAPLLLLSAGWRKRRGSLWLRTTGGILLAAAIVFGIACLAPASAMATASTPATPTIYLLPPSAPASLPTESAPEAPAAQFTTGISTTRVINYTYDPLGRLTAAAYSTGETFGYEYDAVGNISRMTETITSTVVTAYTYDDANRLTHVDGNPLTWDERGNFLEDQYGTVYAYDAANRLIQADKDGVAYEFGYNGLGDRLSQTVNGLVTTYTLDIVSGLTQVLYDGTTYYLYPSTAPRASGLGRIGEKQPDGWVYHVTDGLGSVRQLANSDAYIVLAQSFEPFGGLMEREGDASSVYGFTGEPVDGTGLVYLRARYYAPSFSRFLSADTIAPDLWNPQSINRYAYVSNDPILYVDPTGHIFETPFDFVQVGFDLYDICQNGLTFLSGAALTADVICVLAPFGTGGGEAVRAANRGKNVIDPLVDSKILYQYVDIYDDEGIEYLLRNSGHLGDYTHTAIRTYLSNGTDTAEAADTITRLQEAAMRANQEEFSGSVARVGTKRHTVFRNIIEGWGNTRIETEVSYLGGDVVDWGTKGSVRLDVVEYNENGDIIAIYDYKTGKASLSSFRIKKIQSQLPKDFKDVPIIIIRGN